MQRNNAQISEFKEKLVAVNRVSKTVDVYKRQPARPRSKWPSSRRSKA